MSPYDPERMSKLPPEFKRCGVYKVATLYIVVEWVVLQAAGFPIARLLARLGAGNPQQNRFVLLRKN